MAFLILPSGEQRNVAPAKGKRFTLQELQNFVGGYIELVTLSPKLSMFVNEDGKRLQLARNDCATRFARHVLHHNGRDLFPGDGLVGTVFIFRKGEVD